MSEFFSGFTLAYHIIMAHNPVSMYLYLTMVSRDEKELRNRDSKNLLSEYPVS